MTVAEVAATKRRVGRPPKGKEPTNFEEYRNMRRAASLKIYHFKKNNERAEKLIGSLSQLIPVNDDNAQSISDAFGIPIESISRAIRARVAII